MVGGVENGGIEIPPGELRFALAAKRLAEAQEGDEANLGCGCFWPVALVALGKRVYDTVWGWLEDGEAHGQH
jgi:hypothetical protein